MAGGKRVSLHQRTIHKDYKQRLILRYCNQLFGIANITQPSKITQTFRPGLWVRLETLLFHPVFQNWTNIMHFIEAFEKTKSLYVMETKANILHHKALRQQAKKDAKAAAATGLSKQQQRRQFLQHTSVNSPVYNASSLEEDSKPMVQPTPMEVIKEKGRICKLKLKRRKRSASRKNKLAEEPLQDDEILFVRLNPYKLDPDKHVIPRAYQRIVDDRTEQRQAEKVAQKAAWDAMMKRKNAAKHRRRLRRKGLLQPSQSTKHKDSSLFRSRYRSFPTQIHTATKKDDGTTSTSTTTSSTSQEENTVQQHPQRRFRPKRKEGQAV
jgi:hypothetical protein